MKKYIVLALICFSSTTFALTEQPAENLGQVDHLTSQNDCNRPEIEGCGACFQRCLDHNAAERGETIFSDPSHSPGKKAKTGSGAVAPQ